MIGWARGEARRGLILALHARRAAQNSRKEPPALIRRILVVRPDHLGDLLFATPALRLLRETFPRARITGAVGPWGRPMWANDPDLDALVTIPFPGIERGREGGLFGPYHLLGRAADALARNNYDLGVVLRFDHWWGAALLWAAGVPYRWGYNTAGMRHWLSHHTRYHPGRHEVEQSFRLAEAACRNTGAWRGTPLSVDRERGLPPLRPPATQPLQSQAAHEWLNATKRLIIHPGTGASNKLWTLEGWAEVISRLHNDGWAIALTGSPSELPLTEAILSISSHHLPTTSHQPLNLTGRTANLNQLAWLFTHAGMALGVDSGPLHIAAALSRPTLHLYGPSDERKWGPWGDPDLHRALRAPGTRPTGRLEVGSDALEGGPEMRAITPDMVLSELRQLLKHD